MYFYCFVDSSLKKYHFFCFSCLYSIFYLDFKFLTNKKQTKKQSSVFTNNYISLHILFNPTSKIDPWCILTFPKYVRGPILANRVNIKKKWFKGVLFFFKMKRACQTPLNPTNLQPKTQLILIWLESKYSCFHRPTFRNVVHKLYLTQLKNKLGWKNMVSAFKYGWTKNKINEQKIILLLLNYTAGAMWTCFVAS